MPDEPEAVGLLALMLLTEARRPARTAPTDRMVRLADQDRTRWDRALIAEGHDLVRACLRRNQPGPFQIQAAIAAVHADAADRRRHRLVADRRALRPAPRPAPEPGRRAQPGRRRRPSCTAPAAGLAALDALDTTRLDDYQPFHAARADLLARAGRRTRRRRLRPRHRAQRNPAERRFLEQQRRDLSGS